MLWKLYFGLMSLLVGGSSLVLATGGPHAIYPLADYIILTLSAFQVAGLYGYAFKRPLLTERFWQLALRVFTVNFFATLLIGGARFAVNQGDVGLPAATIFVSLFGIPLFLPLLIADRRYAYRSPEIWKDRSADALACNPK